VRELHHIRGLSLPSLHPTHQISTRPAHTSLPSCPSSLTTSPPSPASPTCQSLRDVLTCVQNTCVSYLKSPFKFTSDDVEDQKHVTLVPVLPFPKCTCQFYFSPAWEAPTIDLSLIDSCKAFTRPNLPAKVATGESYTFP
jgi:hypothetical protein